MNQTTTEIINGFRKELEPVAFEMAKSGSDSKAIAAFIQKQIQRKIRDFYTNEEAQSRSMSKIAFNVFAEVEGCKEKSSDSRAEDIFYNMLDASGIDFKFQISIGNYRVDYLIAGFLIFEGDGPHHNNQKGYDEKRDNFLERMGYQVMRMKWSIIALSPESVIDGIKERIDER